MLFGDYANTTLKLLSLSVSKIQNTQKHWYHVYLKFNENGVEQFHITG